MTSRLFQISLRWTTSGISEDNLTLMDQSMTSIDKDWMRFSAYSYFLWTQRSATEISRALMARHPSEHFIIIAVQPEMATGYADQWVWNWLNDRIQRQYKSVD